MEVKTVTRRSLPAVSILILPYIAAAVLLRHPGDRAPSSLAFPHSSAVPHPTTMNQPNLSIFQDLVPPLVAVLH
ncbi:hypothetical protein BDR07DRAFT_721535 [Suillus spraguei]|nr:hypothetical protein BDR07DRAFT_721535 [Suillus spraguei]